MAVCSDARDGEGSCCWLEVLCGGRDASCFRVPVPRALQWRLGRAPDRVDPQRADGLYTLDAQLLPGACADALSWTPEELRGCLALLEALIEDAPHALARCNLPLDAHSLLQGRCIFCDALLSLLVKLTQRLGVDPFVARTTAAAAAGSPPQPEPEPEPERALFEALYQALERRHGWGEAQIAHLFEWLSWRGLVTREAFARCGRNHYKWRVLVELHLPLGFDTRILLAPPLLCAPSAAAGPPTPSAPEALSHCASAPSKAFGPRRSAGGAALRRALASWCALSCLRTHAPRVRVRETEMQAPAGVDYAYHELRDPPLEMQIDAHAPASVCAQPSTHLEAPLLPRDARDEDQEERERPCETNWVELAPLGRSEDEAGPVQTQPVYLTSRRTEAPLPTPPLAAASVSSAAHAKPLSPSAVRPFPFAGGAPEAPGAAIADDVRRFRRRREAPLAPASEAPAETVPAEAASTRSSQRRSKARPVRQNEGHEQEQTVPSSSSLASPLPSSSSADTTPSVAPRVESNAALKRRRRRDATSASEPVLLPLSPAQSPATAPSEASIAAPAASVAAPEAPIAFAPALSADASTGLPPAQAEQPESATKASESAARRRPAPRRVQSVSVAPAPLALPVAAPLVYESEAAATEMTVAAASGLPLAAAAANGVASANSSLLPASWAAQQLYARRRRRGSAPAGGMGALEKMALAAGTLRALGLVGESVDSVLPPVPVQEAVQREEPPAPAPEERVCEEPQVPLADLQPPSLPADLAQESEEEDEARAALEELVADLAPVLLEQKGDSERLPETPREETPPLPPTEERVDLDLFTVSESSDEEEQGERDEDEEDEEGADETEPRNEPPSVPTPLMRGEPRQLIFRRGSMALPLRAPHAPAPPRSSVFAASSASHPAGRLRLEPFAASAQEDVRRTAARWQLMKSSLPDLFDMRRAIVSLRGSFQELRRLQAVRSYFGVSKLCLEVLEAALWNCGAAEQGGPLPVRVSVYLQGVRRESPAIVPPAAQLVPRAAPAAPTTTSTTDATMTTTTTTMLLLTPHDARFCLEVDNEMLNRNLFEDPELDNSYGEATTLLLKLLPAETASACAQTGGEETVLGYCTLHLAGLYDQIARRRVLELHSTPPNDRTPATVCGSITLAALWLYDLPKLQREIRAHDPTAVGLLLNNLRLSQLFGQLTTCAFDEACARTHNVNLYDYAFEWRFRASADSSDEQEDEAAPPQTFYALEQLHEGAGEENQPLYSFSFPLASSSPGAAGGAGRLQARVWRRPKDASGDGAVFARASLLVDPDQVRQPACFEAVLRAEKGTKDAGRPLGALEINLWSIRNLQELLQLA